MISDKVRPHHLERKALLYVRQSSAHQVLHNVGKQFSSTSRAGSGYLNKISASISGASAKVRPPCGKAAG